MTGARRANDAPVAPTPTHRGVTALTRSALARNPSASAAHWMVAAATSFPSATATLPMYSAPMPREAANAAEAGARTSATFRSANIMGDVAAANTDVRRRDSSRVESCGLSLARLSRSCMSFSNLVRAVTTVLSFSLICCHAPPSSTPPSSSFPPAVSVLSNVFIKLPVAPVLRPRATKLPLRLGLLPLAFCTIAARLRTCPRADVPNSSCTEPGFHVCSSRSWSGVLVGLSSVVVLLLPLLLLLMLPLLVCEGAVVVGRDDGRRTGRENDMDRCAGSSADA
mmetsp:Transcript_10503/g.23548  ORF Transcript_10503/g.23548 Transcript_10503/m.23548 type:complete len:282 (-) Transcript_10503:297-1142(-)